MATAEQAKQPQIHLRVDGRRALLSWPTPADADFPERLRDLLAEQTPRLVAQGVGRIYALADVADAWSLRGLHRNGFLREGRHADFTEADQPARNVYSYARAVSDDSPHFSAIMDSVLPTHRVIAHVLIRDELGRVLYQKVRYKTDWELPGGIVEPNEPPRVAAQRELAEELGVELSVGAALVVDWMPPYLGWSDAIEFIFDGGVIDSKMINDFKIAEEEIESLHWVAADQIAQHVTALSARRMQAILAADGFYYSEDGYRIDTDN